MTLKKLLIISPYFPPSNAADMQRVRMSLPFFKEYGWQAEVVTVDPKYSDFIQDPLLSLSVNNDTKIHYVEALSKKWTSKIGLGSLALRSLWFYKKKVDQILKSKKFDLIFFSTTQFPVCVLGSYWKKKFGVPYVIDMQDPWFSTYYEDKPKNERPPKYWFSSRLNKYLEPVAMKNVDGIISVSDAYIKQLKTRYQEIADTPVLVLPFGYFETDFRITETHTSEINLAFTKSNKTHLVYIGRGGYDMIPAIDLLFTAFKNLLYSQNELARSLAFHFIGTSYAPKGMGKPSFLPLATKMGILEFVNEQTDRITFYESLKALQQADGLIVPGSNDPGYTASKLYPYILSKKPLLGIFQKTSSAFTILSEAKAGIVVDLNQREMAIKEIESYLVQVILKRSAIDTDWEYIETFSAKSMTRVQCDFFNKLIC